MTQSPSARLSRPVFKAAKWPVITIAVVVLVPALLLSTRRASVAAGTIVEPDRSLSLMMTGEEGRLIVGWDREAPAIRSGRCGLLWITDGGIRRRVVLNTSQLRAGKLFYWPVNHDVSFELKMFDGGNAGGELVCGNNLRTVTQSASAARLPASRNRLNPVRISWQMRSESIYPEDATPFRKFAPVESHRPLELAIEMPPPPPVAIVLPVQTAMEVPILAATSPVLRATPGPFSTVTVEVVREPRPGKGALRGSLRRGDAFLPPEPTRKTAPAVPKDLARTLKAEASLDVRVYINRSGRVDYAEMISDLTAENRGLAALGVFDARHWEFMPARLAGHAVPSQLVLHYRYGNTLLAVSRDRR